MKIYEPIDSKNLLKRLKHYFSWYFDMSDDLEDKQQIIQTIKEGVSFRGTNVYILIAAIFVASLGLNVNSAAVIIGAMLISPLMGPIMGMGLGIGILDYALIKRSFRNLAIAAAVSIVTSAIYFLISPLSENRSELLARTSPSVYDVLIAFFGGCAGILAVSSKQKGNVLPGVAIATALMPPLCTAGYGLATLQMNYFLGAFYLFLINSIFIGTATALGTKFFHFPLTQHADTRQTKRVSRIVYTIIVLTLIPSIYLTVQMFRENYFRADANRFIEQEFHFPNTHILDKKVEMHKGKKKITVTLIGQALPLDSLKLAMYEKMQNCGLKGVDLVIEQGYSQDELDIDKLSSQMLNDIYQANQQKIAQQAASIDSLQRIIGNLTHPATLSSSISSELKVIFPEVEAISMCTNIFAKEDGSVKTDTVNIAIVTLRQPLSTAQHDKLKRYLQARSGLDDVTVIDYKGHLSFDKESKSQKK